MLGRNPLDQLVVRVKDYCNGRYFYHEPGQWVDNYMSRISEALKIQGAGENRTLLLTGTPEQGRLTVRERADGKLHCEFDWCTLSVQEALDSRDAEAVGAMPAQQPQPTGAETPESASTSN